MTTKLISFLLALLLLCFCIGIMVVPSYSVFSCGDVTYAEVKRDSGNYYTEDDGVKSYLDVRGCNQLVTYQSRGDQLVVTAMLFVVIVCVLILGLKED